MDSQCCQTTKCIVTMAPLTSYAVALSIVGTDSDKHEGSAMQGSKMISVVQEHPHLYKVIINRIISI